MQVGVGAGGRTGGGQREQQFSFGCLQGEGELGPGLALTKDYFLFLLLLFLTVLLQLHALLVDLPLLLHDTQLILSLKQSNENRSTSVPSVCRQNTVLDNQ